ncbi:MAG: hypothetical protein ACLFP4_15485 [Spirochaetales bacterium]
MMHTKGQIGSIVVIALALSVWGAGIAGGQAPGLSLGDGLPTELVDSLEAVEEARLEAEESANSSIAELYRLYNISITEIFDFQTFRERLSQELSRVNEIQSTAATNLLIKRQTLSRDILAQADSLSSRDRASLSNWLAARFLTFASHSDAFFTALLEAYPALTTFESDAGASSFFATAFGSAQPPDLSPEATFELWVLHAVALPFADRLDKEEAMVDALRDRGEFDALVAQLNPLLVDARVEQRLRPGVQQTSSAPSASTSELILPSVLAATHPAAFASTDEYLSSELDTAAVRRSLRLASSRDEHIVLRLAESSAPFRFFLERMESLLRLASPSERAAFADAIDLDYLEITRIAPRLSYVLSRPVHQSRLAWPEQAVAGGSGRGRVAYTEEELDHFFDLYREQGAEFAAELSRRVQDNEANSGPEYRWAMLSVMNHPYALYSLHYPDRAADLARSGEYLTRAEAAVAREELQRFAEELYGRALGSLDGDERFLVEAERQGGAIGAAYLTTDRLFRSAREDVAERFYRAFVSVAQELDPLPATFFEQYTAGIDRASRWSHQHGLDVAVSQDASRHARDGFVSPWFTLFAVADIPDEGFSHAIRGAAAILHIARESLATIIAASGEPGIATLAPRTAALVEIAQEMIAFRLLPNEGVERIEAMLPPQAETFSTGARIEDVIASETERAVFMLEQAGRDERVVFTQLRGRTRENE